MVQWWGREGAETFDLGCHVTGGRQKSLSISVILVALLRRVINKCFAKERLSAARRLLPARKKQNRAHFLSCKKIRCPDLTFVALYITSTHLEPNHRGENGTHYVWLAQGAKDTSGRPLNDIRQPLQARERFEPGSTRYQHKTTE